MTDPDLTPGPLGPCQPYCGLEDLCCDSEMTDSQKADVIIDASTILYALLGRSIHGICTATVETDTVCASWVDGRARLGSCGRVRDVIHLQGPVVDITQIRVNGSILDPTLYVLRDHDQLMLVDRTSWVGDIIITYSFGVPIPGWLRDACAELAGELWKERCGQDSCLPRGTKSVNRAGISLNIDDEVERVREVGTTLPKCAMAYAIANPTNQRMQANIYSPDDPNELHVVRTFPT